MRHQTLELPTGLTFAIDRHCPSLTVAGELDATSAAVLRGLLLDDEFVQPGRELMVDVSALTFIDATGLRELGAAHDRLAESGGRLTVVGYSPFFAQLAKACDVSGLLAAGGS